jgi:hypothetical protein
MVREWVYGIKFDFASATSTPVPDGPRPVFRIADENLIRYRFFEFGQISIQFSDWR